MVSQPGQGPISPATMLSSLKGKEKNVTKKMYYVYVKWWSSY